MNKIAIVGAVAGLVVGGAAGYLAPHAASARGSGGQFGQGQFMTRGGTGGFAGRGAGGFSAGQILSISGGTLSIQQQSGSSTEIVLTSPSTQVEKTVAGSLSDLTVGAQVVVTGTPNSDGSLTAQNIQIRPAGSNLPIIRTGQ